MSSIFSSARFLTRSLFGGLILALSLGLAIVAIPRHASSQTVLNKFYIDPDSGSQRIFTGSTDFNLDGVADTVIFCESLWSYVIELRSGVNGSLIWTSPPTGAAIFNHDVLLIDDDKYPDIAATDTDNNIIFISGKDGKFIEVTQVESNDLRLFQARSKALFLKDASEPYVFLALNPHYEIGSYRTILRLEQYIETSFFHRICEYKTDHQKALGGASWWPDIDNDGIKEVIFAIPELPYDDKLAAGALFIMKSASCTVDKVLISGASDTKLGQYFVELPDLDRDGLAEVGVSFSNRLLIYSRGSLNEFIGQISLPGTYKFERILPLSDMNGDGTIEYGVVVQDPLKPRSQRVLLISGANNQIIGSVPVDDYAPPQERVLYDLARADVYPGPLKDLNKDGVPDFTIYVRSQRLEEDVKSSYSQVTTISGTCFKEASIEFLNLLPDGLAQIGVRPVTVKATACGVALPGTFSLKVGAKTYAMNDAGKDGDIAAGDLIYSASANFELGINAVTVAAEVNNTVPLSPKGSLNIVGFPNYKVVKKDFEWFTPSGSDRYIFDTRYPKEVTIKAPFAFPFYGRKTSSFYVNFSGYIRPDYPDNKKTGDLFNNRSLPTSTVPDPLIAVAWYEAFFKDSSAFYTQTLGSPGQRLYVLTFEGLALAGRVGGDPFESRADYQVVFNEATSSISMNYKLMYSDDPLLNGGISVTSGLQANSVMGVTFSHASPSFLKPTSIEYIVDLGDGTGGGGTGGGGTGGGGTGGGGTGGGGTGGGSTGGGSTGGGSTGGGSGSSGSSSGNVGGSNSSYGLLFNFAQSKSGARLTFDISSSNPLTLQNLNDCRFSVFAGQGSSGVSANYRNIGSFFAGGGTKMRTIPKFYQRLAAQKSKSAHKLFLRASATCSSSGVNVLSSPQQVKTSKSKGALSISRWLARLSKGLK